MDELFTLADELGPDKIIHIHKPAVGLKAILVVDNVAAGPSIGGARMASDVTLSECARLARAMTLKNAAAGLAHGGGKAVIKADPAMPLEQKEQLIRAFACAIEDIAEYVVGPDMGTNEQCMAWAHDEIHRAVGLPRVLGGIPLDEIGATGFGLAIAADAAEVFGAVKLDGARLAVQGFGAVGRHAARYLAQRGVRLVAAADSRGCVIDPSGIDVEMLTAVKAEGRSVVDAGVGSFAVREAVIGVDCDILIPAARPDAIHEGNVGEIRARLVLEGANIPATADAETNLHRRGVVVVPDFIANAGGVICAAIEFGGGSEQSAFAVIEDRIRRNTTLVLERAQSETVTHRAAANAMALERVRAATALRRFG